MPNYDPKSSSKAKAAGDGELPDLNIDRRFALEATEEQLKKDYRLPNRCFRVIQLDGYGPFVGKWLCDYFDRLKGKRYSLGITVEHQFFVLCLDDSDRSITLEWFEGWEALLRSNVPEQLTMKAHC
jgi:hypothetical protein